MSAIAPSRAFRLNVEEAFRCIARDSRWPTKVGLGAVFSFLSLVLVGAVLVQGYLLTYIERVARAEPAPLPEWDDYGELLRKGAIASLVQIAYYAPLLLALGLIVGSNVGFVLASIVASSGQGGAGALVGLGVMLTIAGYILLFAVVIVAAALLPAAQAQLALHDADLAAAFRLREVVGFISRYRGQYTLAVLIGFAANALLGQLGYLACCIGVFATTFASQLFQAHLIGQLCWHERLTRGALNRAEPY